VEKIRKSISTVSKIDQIEDSKIVRDKSTQKKTINQTIERFRDK